MTLLSEVIELGVALVLGEPLGYMAEKNGNLIQHIYPLKNEEFSSSNESSSCSLDLHTELVFSKYDPTRLLNVDCPDYILLFCLRSDPQKQAYTLIVEISDVCAKLSSKNIEILEHARFELLAPYSFTRDYPGGRQWVGPTPILFQDGMHMNAAFDLACGTRALDKEAETALQSLRELLYLPEVTTKVKLQEGDLLILDNRRCLHGRTPFNANYDGTDRWLLRNYVRRSLQGMQSKPSSLSARIFC